MEKFGRVLRGYDPEEVNAFIDKIIEQFESMVSEIKEKDEQLKVFEDMSKDYLGLKDKMEQFNRMENTLKKAILMAEKTSEQIKLNAYEERDMILDDAKKNANRIINESLLKAESIDKDAENTKRNVDVLKRKLKAILESQLELVDDIEEIEI